MSNRLTKGKALVGSIDTNALLVDGAEITATPAEINGMCDASAAVQSITAAGAVTVDGSVRRVELSGGAYAITLAAPSGSGIGSFLAIEYNGGDIDAVTMALTNVTDGSAATTATFNADGEGVLLYGGLTKWVVVKEYGGVTLA